MIRVKFFPKNSIKNLWGLLPSTMNADLERHLERIGCKQSQSGLNLGQAGVWVSYEDGITSVSQKMDVLNGNLVKNELTILNNNIVLNTITTQKQESEERLIEAKSELEQSLQDLKENSESGEEPKYKELKPRIDSLKDEINHLENQINNINVQALPTVADVTRLEKENQIINEMINDVIVNG